MLRKKKFSIVRMFLCFQQISTFFYCPVFELSTYEVMTESKSPLFFLRDLFFSMGRFWYAEKKGGFVGGGEKRMKNELNRYNSNKLILSLKVKFSSPLDSRFFSIGFTSQTNTVNSPATHRINFIWNSWKCLQLPSITFCLFLLSAEFSPYRFHFHQVIHINWFIYVCAKVKKWATKYSR